MAADNNLGSDALSDMNEMEEAYKYSKDQVNVIAQFDRCKEYDTTNGNWEDCRRYKVGSDYDTAEITSEVVMEMRIVRIGLDLLPVFLGGKGFRVSDENVVAQLRMEP